MLHPSDRAATGATFGLRAWLRWLWRQLTSMKVALLLLLLLAVAAIPGSLVPQRGADPNGVIEYQTQHPQLFKILDAFPIQAFNVYGSAWFSAIYLLLFVSLIGCVLPRVAQHWRALRSAPPKTPANLQRMAGFTQVQVDNPHAGQAAKVYFALQSIKSAHAILRRQRYRAAVQHSPKGAISVSAERGYLRETGNLLFHISLIGVLIAVGLGSAYTFTGQRVLTEGETFVNQVIDYDSVKSGRAFQPRFLTPFSLRLDDLDVTYRTPDEGNPRAIGQVKDFIANLTLTEPNGSSRKAVIRVNHPLRVHGSPVFLLANGYAPQIEVRNASGEVVYREAVPFIPQGDPNLTSLGVVKVLDGITDAAGKPTQLGFRGFFYPTQTKLESGAYTSNYPDLENPVLTLDLYAGDLGVNHGLPQSVYELDTAKLRQLTGRAIRQPSLELRPGETVQLPEGLGSIKFVKALRYASFDVAQNPLQLWILAAALVALSGLIGSLFVPRRRVWVKATINERGVLLEYAGLARGDDPQLDSAIAQLRKKHLAAL